MEILFLNFYSFRQSLFKFRVIKSKNPLMVMGHPELHCEDPIWKSKGVSKLSSQGGRNYCCYRQEHVGSTPAEHIRCAGSEGQTASQLKDLSHTWVSWHPIQFFSPPHRAVLRAARVTDCCWPQECWSRGASRMTKHTRTPLQVPSQTELIHTS